MGANYVKLVKDNIGKLPEGKEMGWVMGTGRCGSASFWNILNNQTGVACEAEFKRCAWTPLTIQPFLINVVRMYGVASFYRDIYLSVMSAMWFLPYTDVIMEHFPHSKIVCLKREKKATVKSWIKKATTPNGHFRNWFTSTESEHMEKSNLVGKSKHLYHGYYKCFPHFDLPFEEAIKAYYDEYYRMSKLMEERYPNNFKTYDSPQVLVDPDYQLGVLDWIGVKEPKFHSIKRNESWQGG